MMHCDSNDNDENDNNDNDNDKKIDWKDYLEPPLFRIPVSSDSHHADDNIDNDTNNDDEEEDKEWILDGSLLWERSTTTTTTAVIHVSRGLKQLQTNRNRVARELQNHNNNSTNTTMEVLSEALVSYALLLRACRDEMNSLLTLNDSMSGSENNNNKSSISFSSVGDETVNTLVVSEPDWLLLKWKTTTTTTTDDDNNNDTIWQRSTSSTAGGVSPLWLWQSIYDWELQHVYWNLALCEWHKAIGSCHGDTRPGWKQAGVHYQIAASWIQHLRNTTIITTTTTKHEEQDEEPPPPPEELQQHQQDDSSALYLSWEQYMMAHAQRAAYLYVCLAPRPSALMLAKLAAGAVPLFQTAATTTTTNKEETAVAVWTLWQHTFQAAAHYHQAVLHSTKQQQHTQAHARLQRATIALQQYNHTTTSLQETNIPQRLTPLFTWRQQLQVQIMELQQTIQTPTTSSSDSSSTTIDLPEIPPQILVQVPTPPPALAESAAAAAASPVVFPRLSDTALRYRQRFLKELSCLLQQTTQMVETKTEQARQALAQVDLPQALIRQQQQQHNTNSSNTTNPQPQQAATTSSRDCAYALWTRVEHIQRGTNNNNNNSSSTIMDSSNCTMGLSQLQQGLWELRDRAEQAHALLHQIQQQLEENVTLDREFHQEHSSAKSKFTASFSVVEIQSSFWTSLQKYRQLLQSASAGDEVLFGRLETLPTDPKFQLLSKLTYSQLQRILQAATNNTTTTAAPNTTTMATTTTTPSSNDNNNSALTESMERLNQQLLKLSSLFQTREELIHSKLPHEMHAALNQATLDLFQQQQDNDNENEDTNNKKNDPQIVIQQAQSSVQTCLQDIRSNIHQQTMLLQDILRENQTFSQLVRNQGGSTAATTTHAESHSAAAATTTDKAYSPHHHNNHHHNKAGATAERTLFMLEEALLEMEQFQNHWQQGRVFYQGVIPKLQKLQQQVYEVSTRLAIDRCEYLDEMARIQQEAKDAALAAAMMANTTTTSTTQSEHPEMANDDDDDDHMVARLHQEAKDAAMAAAMMGAEVEEQNRGNHLSSKMTTTPSTEHSSSFSSLPVGPLYPQQSASSSACYGGDDHHAHQDDDPSLLSMGGGGGGGGGGGIVPNHHYQHHGDNKMDNNHDDHDHHHDDDITQNNYNQYNGRSNSTTTTQQQQQEENEEDYSQQQQQQYCAVANHHNSYPHQPTTTRHNNNYDGTDNHRYHQEHQRQRNRTVSPSSQHHLPQQTTTRREEQSSFTTTTTTTNAAAAVVVDDEKVASLVAMEFDFDLVVQALQRHNNDVEQALNELLATSIL